MRRIRARKRSVRINRRKRMRKTAVRVGRKHSKRIMLQGKVIRARRARGTTRTKVLRRPHFQGKYLIAVTGSAGKTTTKEMIASILRRRWLTYKSVANHNYIGNTLGHARRIRPYHRAAVLEFGMLRRGDIRRHCRIIRPSIGVITNIGTAHIGNFGGSIHGVALEKSSLIRHMKRNGWVFLNADCPHSRKFNLQPYRGGFAGKIISVGVQNPAEYQANNVQYDNAGMRFECKLNGREYSFFIPVHGEHNIVNALLAIAVTHSLGFTPEEIQTGLRSYSRPQRRLMTYRYNSIQVIDDSYSANPNAMKAALNVLSETGKGTNVAVFGSALELGRYTVGGHMDVGRYLATKKVNYLYTFGQYARHIAIGAIRAGFPKHRVRHCTNRLQLHRFLARVMKPNTTFLVKGSKKMKMDLTAGFLRVLASKQPRVVNNEQEATVQHIPTQASVEAVLQQILGSTGTQAPITETENSGFVSPQDQTHADGAEQQD